MKEINLAYIRILYNYLFGIPDDEIECTFDINDPADRKMFFAKAKSDFNTWGPKTRREILSALEFVLSAADISEYWRDIIPHDLPITVNTDKRKYVLSLYIAISDHEPDKKAHMGGTKIKRQLDANWNPKD